MIDWNEKLGEAIAHPIPSGIAGIAMTTWGALNKFAESLPVIHDILADVSMLIGVATCIAAFIVQVRIGKAKAIEIETKTIEREMRLLERDHFAAKFMHERRNDEQSSES
jgi:hypothetical protein